MILDIDDHETLVGFEGFIANYVKAIEVNATKALLKSCRHLGSLLGACSFPGEVAGTVGRHGG
jgi:hypothetical protein